MSDSHATEIQSAYARLDAWCKERDYAGHDPFDALNSRVFRATPFARSRAARLVWTQAFKRSPLNLRFVARVPAEKNPKGTALFALAALAEFRRTKTKESESKARSLLDDLLAARLRSRSGAACWGYNFDWQGRAFFAPRGTPTIVPTATAARALVEAARAFHDEDYLRVARSACDFVLHDLNRSEEGADEICWSYSPLDKTRVYNASLLAAETLGSVGALTRERELTDWAVRGARYCVRRQREDGSWAYGADSYQSWSDNFHTAFVLTSLARITKTCADAKDENPDHADFQDAIRRGARSGAQDFFWRTAGPAIITTGSFRRTRIPQGPPWSRSRSFMRPTAMRSL